MALLQFREQIVILNILIRMLHKFHKGNLPIPPAFVVVVVMLQA